MNDDYVRRIEDRLEALSPLLVERAIVLRRPTETLLIIRVDLRFVDGSRFEGNEIWARGGRKYRFHLMDEQGGLIWRIDNAPHHPQVSTPPHHKHTADGRVEGAPDSTLADTLLLLGERKVRARGA